VEAESQTAVDKAKTEIKRILTEATFASLEAESRHGTGRYSVV
jgi:ATP-dependent RNA helicase DDX46/PRP5